MNTLKATTVECHELYVISDVHLTRLHDGIGPETEALAGRVSGYDVCAGIQRVLDDGGTIAINGDLFDLDRAASPTKHRSYLLELQEEVPDHPIWRLLEHERVHLIAGNHDVVTTELFGASTRLDVVWNDRHVRIEHGHRFDSLIKKFRRFTSFVTWINGLMDARRFAPLRRAMRAAETLLTNDDGGQLMARAMQWLEQHPSYQYLVIGHTHELSMTDGGTQKVVNTGHSTSWPIDLVRIDLARGDSGEIAVDFLAIDTRDVRGPDVLKSKDVEINPSRPATVWMDADQEGVYLQPQGESESGKLGGKLVRGEFE